MKKAFKSIFWIVLILFIIRIFLFQVYKVEDFKMSSSLLPGDKVLVNKFKTGSRTPISLLGLPGVEKSYNDAFRLPYLRIPGFRKFKRNDIVVFNDPRYADKALDRSELFISRIAGVPGDTLFLLDKELHIDRNKVNSPSQCRYLYRIVTQGQPIPIEFVSEYNLEQPELIADIGIYDMSMDSVAHDALNQLKGTKNVRLRRQFYGDSSKDYFPYSSFFNWNRDQFGPLVIPQKGLEVELSLKNVDLFKDIIQLEGNDIIVDFSGVTINGVKSDSYTFKADYYFVLDDNRGMPNDTRIIGFVPETHLLGTSKRVVYSGKSEFGYLKQSLKRVYKKIDKR